MYRAGRGDGGQMRPRMGPPLPPPPPLVHGRGGGFRPIIPPPRPLPCLGQPLPPGSSSAILPPPLPANLPADGPSLPPPPPRLPLPSQPLPLAHPNLLTPPPPKPNDEEIVRNIEILSQFVVKNGPEFENMARAKQAGNPKFSFLFGGPPGSDAAIGLQYFQWFKMKCQLDSNMSREAESRAQLVDTSVASKSSQQPTAPKVASEGTAMLSPRSDTEMDVDMEDDIALPMLPAKDDENVQFSREMREEPEPAVSKPYDQLHTEHLLSSSSQGVIGDEGKNVTATSGSHMESSPSVFQEAKEKCLQTFEGPCVEDLSPVRHLPKELENASNVDKQGIKHFSIFREDPAVVFNEVQERDTLNGYCREVITDPAYEPTKASSALVTSETMESAEKKNGDSLVHDEMECKKVEAVVELGDESQILNEGSHSLKNQDGVVSWSKNSSMEPHNVKSDMESQWKPDEKPVKVDKLERIIRKGNSDSESDGDVNTAKVAKMGPSRGRSPSPGYNRWGKRSYSRSPRRKGRWSRSHSRSPKRHRSRSRTPVHDFRHGVDSRGDRVSRGKGTAPACNAFARGRCYRGASCRFFHQEASGDNAGRWSGGGKGRERIENRQDIIKGGKENPLFSEIEKPKTSSNDLLFSEHDGRNLGEKRYQEAYRDNDWAATPCYNFLKGRCYRGASCRFLHQETTSDNADGSSGGGRGRERSENRQDINNFLGYKESSAVVEVDVSKSTSPNRIRNEQYRHNIRERRSQEVDKRNERGTPACIYYARGWCQRGASCRYVHQDAPRDNSNRWYNGERSRERMENRQDITKSFVLKESSPLVEEDKTTNISVDMNFDVRDRCSSGTRKSQDVDKHNDSSVSDKVFPACDANAGLKLQLPPLGREEFQVRREGSWSQTLPREDVSSQHFQEGGVKHDLLPKEDLCPKSASREGTDAQPLLQEGLCASSPFMENLGPHNLREEFRSQPLPKSNSQLQVELHSREYLHSKSVHPLSRDLPPLMHQGVMGHSTSSSHSLGSGSSSVPLHINFANNVDPPPPGYPINSHVVHQPAKISESGGCQTSNQYSHIPAVSSSFSQPGFVPGTVQERNFHANASADVAATFTEQRSLCSQVSSEPFSSLNVLSSGQQSHMLKPVTMPTFSPVSRPGAQLGLLPMFGEQQTYLYTQIAEPCTPGPPTVNQPSKDMPAQGDQYDPLHDSIEPSFPQADESMKEKVLDYAKENDIGAKELIMKSDATPLLENVSPHNEGGKNKTGFSSGPQDIVANDKNKDGPEPAPKRFESDEAAQADAHGSAAQADTNAGVSVVQNGSPGHEGKNWSPGHRLAVVTAGAGDTDLNQTHAQDESKKNKEIRMMKLFRSVLAEFVKDVLKPTWREGHMSKEAFKTIVKKVVDKVTGTLQSHQIPKTQERIDQYVASSRPKLTKLVQGYVDKYAKP
eukprot:Gb_26302 [translate_table: standard]